MTTTCKGQNMTENVHEFKTVQSIADSLKIKRQTLYNRAKKTGVDISKKSFTDEEWLALVNNKKLTNVKNDNDEKLTEIDILKGRIDEQSSFIDTLKKELDAKNQQIDQAQKLQLIAEQKLSELSGNKNAIELDDDSSGKKRGFFKNFFKL